MEARVDGRTVRYQHRRGELLEAVGEYVLEHGVANLSLRRAAEAVGVSHVTLQHHFGNKQQLMGEIVEHLLERTLIPSEAFAGGTPNPQLDLPTRWHRLWEQITSTSGQRDIRLFEEVLAQSQSTEPAYAPIVSRSIKHRLELTAANAVALGCPEEDAMAFATVALATLRGLVIDLLATGERKRVDAAFERALETIIERTAGWQAGEPPIDLDGGRHAAGRPRRRDPRAA